MYLDSPGEQVGGQEGGAATQGLGKEKITTDSTERVGVRACVRAKDRVLQGRDDHAADASSAQCIYAVLLL